MDEILDDFEKQKEPYQSLINKYVYKVIFYLFSIESIMIMFGIGLEVISYGTPLANRLMGIIVFVIMILAFLFTKILDQFNNQLAEVIRMIFSLFLIIVGLFYILENSLKLTLQ